MTPATPITEALETLMPEPAMRSGEYAGPPGEGALEDLYTADQMREMYRAATERAAKLCDEQADDHTAFKNTQAAIGCDGCAAAIRGGL